MTVSSEPTIAIMSAMSNALIADMIAIVGSLDTVMGEVDR